MIGIYFSKLEIVSSGLGDENTVFPATKTFAPALNKVLQFSKFTPPSISISVSNFAFEFPLLIALPF